MKPLSSAMKINFKGDVGYLTFKELEKYNFINHAFSTRSGGVSKGEFESMNLGFLRGDEERCVKENYKIFCSALGFNINKLVRTSQIHGTHIQKITQDYLEKDFNGRVCAQCDGLVTNLPEVVLATFHADCPAIFMIDTSKKVVGLAHAGWRGTVAKVAQNLKESFEMYYDSCNEDIVCAIGPGIGKCCFETSRSILPQFESLGISNFYAPNKNNLQKINIDLLEVNRQILLHCGIDEKNIFTSDICTMCNRELLFSHRATQGKRGNNAAFISLRK